MNRTTLAVLVALVAAPVHAANLGYLQNKAGGRIVLTDEKCQDNKSLIVYGTTDEGQTLWGCWTYVEPDVFVRWENGKVYAYPVSEFTSFKAQPARQPARGM